MPDLEGAEGMVDQAFDFMGVGLLEDEIDDVIFQTNQFLLNSDFIGSNGPFWWQPFSPLSWQQVSLTRCMFAMSRLMY